MLWMSTAAALLALGLVSTGVACDGPAAATPTVPKPAAKEPAAQKPADPKPAAPTPVAQKLAVPQPPVMNMSDDKAWNDAEAAVRQGLERAKIVAKEVRRSPGATVRVFGVTTADDKALYAAVAGDKVHLSTDKRQDATVEALLKSERVLERTDIRASDIILLVHAFGVAPDTIKKTIDSSTTGRAVVPGHSPTLNLSKDGGRLEIFAPRPGRYGAEAKPTDHLYKGILTISKAYKIKWKVESVDLPSAVGLP